MSSPLQAKYTDLMNLMIVKKLKNPSAIVKLLGEIRNLTVSMTYQGAWDASTGAYPTPTPLVQGYYYVVSVAGAVGAVNYDVGDWAVYNGASWDKLTQEITNINEIPTRNHADIQNVTADQHHAQSHTLASHSTKAHAELTGVGANDHHAKSHAINSALDHSMGNDKIIYSTGAGVITELVLGAAGSYLKSQGLGVAPTWAVPAGGIANVVEDLSPELGADLDCLTRDIVNLGSINHRVYYVSTDAQFDAAIAAITAATPCAGRIVLAGETFTNVQATLNAANCSFVIEGNGDATVLDANGDNIVITITNAKSVVLKNFKIDATDLTTTTKEIIRVEEASGNPVLIDNVTIIGDGANGYGIKVVSGNCTVRGCHVSTVNYGISINTLGNNVISGNVCSSNNNGIVLAGSTNNIINGNTCNSNAISGITLSSTSNDNAVSGNTCKSNAVYGILLSGSNDNTVTGNTCNANNLNSAASGGGIWLNADANNNTMNGNTCNNNNNAGAGTGNGIRINSVDCDNNTVIGNTCLNNESNLSDSGTSTFKQIAASDANNIA